MQSSEACGSAAVPCLDPHPSKAPFAATWYSSSDRCALQDKYLTYRQLDERANQLARFLEANGVRSEQPVGVMLERSLELMVAMMGVLKAGGAFVPMDPEYPADRLAIMAEDAEVSACTPSLKFRMNCPSDSMCYPEC